MILYIIPNVWVALMKRTNIVLDDKLLEWIGWKYWSPHN